MIRSATTALFVVALVGPGLAAAEITWSGSTPHRQQDGRDWKFAPRHHQPGVGQRLDRPQSFGTQRHDGRGGDGTVIPFSQHRGSDDNRGDYRGDRHDGRGRSHRDGHDGHGRRQYGQRHDGYGNPYHNPYARPYGGSPYGRHGGYLDPRSSYRQPYSPYNPYNAYAPYRPGQGGGYSGPPPGRSHSTVPRLVPRDGRRH